MAKIWQSGDLIRGRYRLVSLLGKGGMGSVWRAQHTELRNEVAIKLLDPTISANEEMVGRFLTEARAAASLQYRHVIRIFDHGVEDGEAFMVMELLEGQTLGERLKAGALPVEDTIKFMVQVMRAMAKAHEAGIIHRDLKPDNIFITFDDEGEFAKVLDFGVAKVAGDLGGGEGVKTQTGMMLGTPYYMSPEQAKAKTVDARTDIWAMAVITFECMTGRRPFLGQSFADLVLTLCTAPIPMPSKIASVPIGFDEWFFRATERDVAVRTPSSRALATGLMALSEAQLTGEMSETAARRRLERVAPKASASEVKMSSSEVSLSTMQNAAVGMTATQNRRVKDAKKWKWLVAAVVTFVGSVGTYALSSGPSRDASPRASGAPIRVISLDPPAPVEEKPTGVDGSVQLIAPVAKTEEKAKMTAATDEKAAMKKGSARPIARPQPPRAKSPSPQAAPSTKDKLPPKQWEF